MPMREHKVGLPWRFEKLFRARYDSIIDEPLPDRCVELIRALHDRERVARNKNAESRAAPKSREP